MSLQNLKSEEIGHSMNIAYLSDIPTLPSNIVQSLTAGTDISITGTSSNPTINYIGAGGGGVASVSAGTGINITGSATNPMVNNTGVLGLTAGTDINITGTAQNPIINYIGGAGGGVATVSAGTAISITGTPTDPIINYVGGVGGGVDTVVAGTNIILSGTVANPQVNLSNNVEIPDGGYIGIGGSNIPVPIPLVNCLRMYKNPTRTLWSAFLTAPNPPPPLVGGDALNLVNESKDFDALSVGNLKVYNQGDNYDVVNPFLHIGAVAGSQWGIAYNDPNNPPETLFMDTNNTVPTAVNFSLYNINQINGANYFIPTLAQFFSKTTQPAVGTPANTPVPLTYDGKFVSINGLDYDPLTPSVVKITIAGTYKILTTIQLDGTAGGANYSNVWLNVAGNPVPLSNSVMTVGNNDGNIIAVEWFYTFPVPSYFEVMFSSTTGQSYATFYPPVVGQPQPETPSIITSVQRIA